MAGSRDSGRAGAGPSRHWWQCQGHGNGNGRSWFWASRVPWAMLAPKVWAGVDGCDASSPGSPLQWPGGPRKPAAPAAPSWERGSSCPGPAATAPLPFIYIFEKELATIAAASSRGPWPRSWGPSPCPQPCGSAWSPPRSGLGSGTVAGGAGPVHGHRRCATGALNATGQRCPALPCGTAVPAAAPLSPLLFLAAVSFSWHFVVRSDLLRLRLPCWAAAGRSTRASPRTASTGAAASLHPALLGCPAQPGACLCLGPASCPSTCAGVIM